MKISHFTELNVYNASRQLSNELFRRSLAWPKEEKYSLVDQSRRAARSVGANLAESWAKRRYEAHFTSKLTDADAENHETEHWLICAMDCGYITTEEFERLLRAKQDIGRMIGAMLQNPTPFLLR